MAAAGAVALSVYAPVLSPLFATLAVLMAASRVHLARAPRLRRRGGPRRGRLHGRGLRAAGRPDGEPRGRHRRTAQLGQDVALQRAHGLPRRDHELRRGAGLGQRRHRGGAGRSHRRARRGRLRARSRARRRCSSRTSPASCAAAAPATAGSAASTSATCARPHALAHVVRCFDDEAVSHPDGRIDPVLDAEAVDFELLLSDQVLVARRRERTERAARVGEKSARDELVVLERPRSAPRRGPARRARSTSRSPRVSTC